MKLTREEQEQVVRSITRTCRGPILDQGSVEENRPSTHKGCGYDVNNILCKHPFDGVVRTENCPNCGVEHVFHTTPFPEE